MLLVGYISPKNCEEKKSYKNSAILRLKKKPTELDVKALVVGSLVEELFFCGLP